MFSASEEEDLLNQWAHYSGAGGFELGISTQKKFDVLVREPVVAETKGPPSLLDGWWAVIYDPAVQQESARLLLETALQQFKTSFTGVGFESTAAWRSARIKTWAAFWKDPAFRAEREVRYVTALSGTQHPKFRVSGSRLIPYVELRLQEADERPQRFLIGQVRLGPGVDVETENNVRSLLAANGLATLDVWRSKVPYASRRT
ncbi:DUF2971 domain-containing protein [Demequina lutea]|uniref:DUF2971 domain-containing protein n=1 Tax=Demequina lutea TaxID=431489 RepID=A0A7Y9ZCC1_9MICO|nr:DUF2971 domain-containing protein [Demequina lutea]NYI42516.1 hypothetical protein [Demequina lutea]